SFDLLHGLATGHGSQRIGKFARLVFSGELVPELFCTAAGQGVLLLDTTTQTNDFFCAVVTGDTRPARVVIPVLLELICCCLNCLFHVSPYITVQSVFTNSDLPKIWLFYVVWIAAVVTVAIAVGTTLPWIATWQ